MKQSIVRRVRTFTMLSGLFVAAACGLGKPEDKGPPPPTQAGSNEGPAPGSIMAPGPTLAAIAIARPENATCLHRHPDGTCIVPGPDDEDGDGFSIGRDCDDHDPHTYPGAPEARC